MPRDDGVVRVEMTYIKAHSVYATMRMITTPLILGMTSLTSVLPVASGTTTVFARASKWNPLDLNPRRHKKQMHTYLCSKPPRKRKSEALMFETQHQADCERIKISHMKCYYLQLT